MPENPIVRISITDSGTGEQTPADVRTRAEAVECDAEGTTLEQELSAIDTHMSNSAIHSTAYIKNMVLFTIPNTGWQEVEPEDADFPYSIEIDVDGVLETHNAQASVDLNSIGVAASCGLCPTLQTLHNKIKFWTKEIPSTAITGSLTLFGGGGVSGGDAESTDDQGGGQ